MNQHESQQSSGAALAPLVETGPQLRPEERAWYARHVRIPQIGNIGQRRLRAARVLLIGAGGIGSPVALYLAAAGVGTIGLVDDDSVEVSNLQRQIIHPADRVGEPKTASAAKSLSSLAPHVKVEQFSIRLTEDNAVETLTGWDLVIDGSDNFSTRYLVNDACAIVGVPCVWGSLLTFEAQYTVFWNSAPNGREIDYRDLFPKPPPLGFAPSCAEAGVLGALCGFVGSAMALEAIKLITGTGVPALGTLCIFDALTGELSRIPLRRTALRDPITQIEPVREQCPAGVVEMSVAQAHEALEGSNSWVLVDVREDDERQEEAIPGSVHMPLEPLLAQLSRGDLTSLTDISQQRSPTSGFLFHCHAGSRSLRAAAACTTSGLTAASMAGGIAAWRAAQFPTHRSNTEESA